MKIQEILNLLEEKKDWHKANEYSRVWNPKAGKKGLWEYKHRAKLGLYSTDTDKVVHHKNGNIHDNRKSNLEVVSRAKHAALGKPALKHEKCKYCKEKHFAHGLCRHHYFKKYKK